MRLSVPVADKVSRDATECFVYSNMLVFNDLSDGYAFAALDRQDGGGAWHD